MKKILLIPAFLVSLSAAKAHASGEEITDPRLHSELQQAILAADYACPAVKRARGKGLAAEGVRIKVWCGPAGEPGVYEKLIFMVTVRPSGRIQVEKSSLFGQ